MKFKKIEKYEDLPKESGVYLVYHHCYIYDNDASVVAADYFRSDESWRVRNGMEEDVNALLPIVLKEDEIKTDYISHWAEMPEFEEEDNGN